MGSSGDSEKVIQRLNDELREAQELANTEKHKCMELQGEITYTSITSSKLVLCTRKLTTTGEMNATVIHRYPGGREERK